MHKSKSEKQQVIMESGFPVLNQAQTNTLLKKILCELKKTNDKVEKLEKKVQILSKKQKVHLEHWLKEYGPIPTQTLREWLKDIPLTSTHLEIVFKSDLLTAMMTCIREALESMDVDGIPCCAFVQKQNTLYFYDVREKNEPLEPKWMLLSNDVMISMLSVLSSRFVSLYLKYSNNPSPEYAKNWAENDTTYFCKVWGKESCESTRAKFIKEYLYNTLKRDFVEFEIL